MLKTGKGRENFGTKEEEKEHCREKVSGVYYLLRNLFLVWAQCRGRSESEGVSLSRDLERENFESESDNRGGL